MCQRRRPAANSGWDYWVHARFGDFITPWIEGAAVGAGELTLGFAEWTPARGPATLRSAPWGFSRGAHIHQLAPPRAGLFYSRRLPEQLRQPRNVDGDPSRLVLRQHLSLPSLSFVVAGVEVGKGLPVGVPDA
jgi:hypothetical protein